MSTTPLLFSTPKCYLRIWEPRTLLTILGLIWTIILCFQIQEIEIETAPGKRTEKELETLLLCCRQRRTNGYQHVDIKDFSQWLDLINFTLLSKDAHQDNPKNAFDSFLIQKTLICRSRTRSAC